MKTITPEEADRHLSALVSEVQILGSPFAVSDGGRICVTIMPAEGWASDAAPAEPDAALRSLLCAARSRSNGG